MTLEIRKLKPEEARRTCHLEELEFKSTAELEEPAEIIGQERAMRAIEFGVDIPCFGYNIYALGPTGAGRMTTIRTFLERKAQTQPVPNDWAYVNNFNDNYQPRAIPFPPGGACAFRDEMNELLRNLRDEIPRAFEGEEYEQHRSRIGRELEAKRREEFQRMEAYAAENSFSLVRTPMGLALVPAVAGQTLSAEQYEALDAEMKKTIEEKRPAVQEQIEKAMRHVRELEREAKDRFRNLDREIASFTIGHFFESLKEKYSDHEEVLEYLEEVRKDIIDNIEIFKAKPEGQEGNVLPSLPSKAGSPFDRYQVNVIVDNSRTKGAPVVLETNPTLSNLMGRIEHRAEFGALVTDFTMIKGGALHRANGGYLVLDAKAVLRYPLVWDSLKRAIRNKEIRVEELGQQLGLFSTATLTPEPIPLGVKVVLIGDPITYYYLYALDDDFQELFKVRADFGSDMDWNPENVHKYARFIHERCCEENFPHFNPEAVAKVVEYGARLAENKNKLSTRFAHVADIVREAAYWASRNGHELVRAEDVQRAVEERVYRSSYVEELLRERIADGTIMVDTKGEVAGQVNGLSILLVGDYSFGRPSRITARTFMGQAGVINIEREAKLSGKIHDKGMLILSGYLGGKYAQKLPLSLSTSICFEQSYEEVEGDSASSAELYALLSSLSGFPIKQGIAVTGSVNQKGEIQPIGGVNKKIEGFFDVCKLLGLTGEQGVIIPEGNVKNLMLREDVVDATSKGLFHIYPVRTIDEGITILTGVEAGQLQEDGTYPEGTVNHAVAKRLEELAKEMKALGREEGAKKTER